MQSAYYYIHRDIQVLNKTSLLYRIGGLIAKQQSLADIYEFTHQ